MDIGKKRLSIMQPYFFPYLGYFSLINSSDHFVFFDDVQFIRHGWIERNRVLNSNLETSYIKVSLNKFKREEKIKNVTINYSIDWKKKIFDQLTSYRKAPFYKETIDLIGTCLFKNHESISTLNIEVIKIVCNYLGINFKYHVYSEMNLSLENLIKQPGDWALEISKELEADCYINPPGGIKLFDKKVFLLNNINLFFCENNLSSYKQMRNKFQKGLSIIDVLMFNSKQETIKLINDYTLKNEK